MGKSEIREPKQRRSIEKKNKIIETGFQLFCEKGFYNTNTAEIAKAAGVSTGIVYNYFKDKKEIFMAGIMLYGRMIAEPMFDLFLELDPAMDFPKTISILIDRLVTSHGIAKKAHEEMEVMIHSDIDVARIYIDYENEICHKLTDIIKKLGVSAPNLHERVHLAYHLVENYCHEMVYHKHDCMNYAVMKQILVEALLNIFKMESP